MTLNCLQDIDVVVLAGGLGTRISPVLKDTPKILAPVGGQPYLVFLLYWLKSFGVRRVIFGLGHLAGAVSEFLDKNPVEGIEFSIVIEDKPLGTAGAITNVRPEIRSNPVLIMNGDSFIDVDFCEFVAFHLLKNSEGSILCTNIADLSRYGAVNIDSESRIVAFKEKTIEANPGFINAGIYLFNSNILNEIENCGPSLERDYFQKQAPGKLTAMSVAGEFLDIGTPEDLLRAPTILGKYRFSIFK
jgi:NDP-sugar pyrophosphorylase family protein